MPVVIDWVVVAQTVAAVSSALATGLAAYATYRAPHSAAELADKLRRSALTHEVKLDTLRRVIGLRSSPPTDDWLVALNEVLVTFNNSSTVIDKLKQMIRTINKFGGHDNSELLDLLKAMIDDLGLQRSDLDDNLLLTTLRRSRSS